MPITLYVWWDTIAEDWKRVDAPAPPDFDRAS